MDTQVNANERVKTAINWLIDNGYAPSQRRMAELMNYNPSTISLITNGKINVTPKFARAMKEFSKGVISDDWLYYGKGNMLCGNTSESNIPTIIDVTFERDHLEDVIAMVVSEFYKHTGIIIDTIECSHKDEDNNNVAFDIRIPINIPSAGSAVRQNEDVTNKEDVSELSVVDVPPIEFEEAVISICMKYEGAIRKIQYLSSEMFSDVNLGIIYKAMWDMEVGDMPIDGKSVAEFVVNNYAEELGVSRQYIEDLQNVALNDGHLEYYADCIYNYAVSHNPKEFEGYAIKDFTQINPAIKEAYESFLK